MIAGIAEHFSMSGRRAVVTGGGRGLGRAISEAFAACGAEIFLVGRNEETLRTAAAEISAETGARVTCGVADVAEEDQVRSIAGQVRDIWGGLDILVNNAGVNPIYKDLSEVSLRDWRNIMSVNLDGTFLCCRHLGAMMVEAGAGSIINISSIAGHVGLRKCAPYCASKGGVELLTRSLALDWASKGVRVNCIAPGFFETDLTEDMRNHGPISERLLGRTPLGRFGTLGDIVGAAVYLASPAGAYVTGQSLVVDGGWTAA